MCVCVCVCVCVCAYVCAGVWGWIHIHTYICNTTLTPRQHGPPAALYLPLHVRRRVHHRRHPGGGPHKRGTTYYTPKKERYHHSFSFLPVALHLPLYVRRRVHHRRHPSSRLQQRNLETQPKRNLPCHSKERKLSPHLLLPTCSPTSTTTRSASSTPPTVSR